MTSTPLPILSGLKVLDFTQYVAGPTVTRLMAALGAYVIKVEQAPTGDLLRLAPWLREGRSSCFVQHNRGKRSLAVDLEDPAGLALGLVPAPGVPLKFSESPVLAGLPAPLLGQHNEEILAAMLDWSAEEVATLATKGVLISAHR